MFYPVERAYTLPVLSVISFPWLAQLGFPLPLVMVVPVVRDVEDFTRSGYGTLEAVGLCDHVVREDSTI